MADTCKVSFKHINRGLGETNQSVKHLPCEREGLSSIPRTHLRMLGVAACACNPIARELRDEARDKAR